MIKNRTILGNNEGMALLITIMVISLLVAVTIQFSRGMRQNYLTAATSMDGWQQHLIANSALNIGSLLLENDGEENDFDSLQDVWGTLEAEVFQGLFARGELELQVQDLSGLLQINSLVEHGKEGENNNNANENREILKQLLLSGTFELEGEEMARDIVDALVDWLDEDDRESDFGAESGYYRSLNEPYSCRNGAVATIEELLLVKGITPELLMGEGDNKGLADFVTVFGNDGTININTAPGELIRAMAPQLSMDMIDTLTEYRKEEGNRENLKEKNWYNSVSGWPGDIILPEKVITTKSTYFRLVAAGSFHDLRREIIAVMERDKDNHVGMLYKKVE
ncbi:type II secretion system minor pseudopilin GspK [Desulfopila sp. IMCC35008]|uniref:type II secretion system minor pseudopilin GspK n=1 Tax=Desulfopila sp. IMCC35008 TaxID=2653858 RepID=UPI0013D5C848|nr:type II secretion system minor pseudopilin GspK [Desulfopila sp. IMCC35008]